MRHPDRESERARRRVDQALPLLRRTLAEYLTSLPRMRPEAFRNHDLLQLLKTFIVRFDELPLKRRRSVLTLAHAARDARNEWAQRWCLESGAGPASPLGRAPAIGGHQCGASLRGSRCPITRSHARRAISHSAVREDGAVQRGVKGLSVRQLPGLATRTSPQSTDCLDPQVNAFPLLQAIDDLEQVPPVRIAGRTEHVHQAHR